MMRDKENLLVSWNFSPGPCYLGCNQEGIGEQTWALASLSETQSPLWTGTLYRCLWRESPLFKLLSPLTASWFSEVWLFSCLWWVLSTDIERRSQNSYTALCNGILSHEAPIGGYSGFCRPHTRKQTQTKCTHDLCAPYGVSHVSSCSCRLQYILTWWIMVTLIAGKIRIPPILAPYQDKDGPGSGISSLYLWCCHNSVTYHLPLMMIK